VKHFKPNAEISTRFKFSNLDKGVWAILRERLAHNIG